MISPLIFLFYHLIDKYLILSILISHIINVSLLLILPEMTFMNFLILIQIISMTINSHIHSKTFINPPIITHLITITYTSDAHQSIN
jgi:hypothetical protein